ncbi:uncharacterized protein A4U43_C03F15290 [Asparagus officinalis]|uniref:TOG domain-containing protein n=1 Tax=Asparagus officinalis TaxID=4686 RepID=A0A5P1FD34_ASPOF|nr:uncharacterized protein A4U43_C03F15290 [Asparagus officinalis]
MDQNQLQAILGSDLGPFQALISQLMATANDQRSHAESIFNFVRDQHPDNLALKLAHLLQSSTLIEIRAMSAILLRKQLTSSSSSGDSQPAYLWPRLTSQTQLELKSMLLSSVQREEVKSISKKLCDTVSELASNLLPDNAWPELLPFMFQAVTSENARLQESSLLIFSQLAQYIGDLLLPHLQTLHDVFLQSLTHSSSADVRIASLGASINFIQCLALASDRDKFQDLLPAMMRTLTESLNSGQEATAQEALELLIELAGTEPRFLRRQLPDVIGAMLQIAEADGLEEGTRHLAVEFVITLAEARERSVEDEDAGETSNYSVGQECLDRISIALGGNTIVPVASELLPAYLAAPEWQKHHAALITLAQIAEGCSKVMIKNLEQVVNMVLNSFQDPHPRVRWAAINAIGQLSTDLGPDLQVQYHQRVLPALASAMDDFQNPRVQAHAASAVLNFSENCTPDILTPYLDGIVSKLLVLLQNGKQMVQEGALTALASVADSSQEHFQKYYDAVMPYLKAILMNATDKSNRMLRAKSMECISLVGMAVGKEKFRDDAKQVMEVLMSLQGSQMEADDPITSYMLQAWARLCKCLGQDFLPYMSVVMPPLLQSAHLKPDVTITSADSDDDIDESDDERYITFLTEFNLMMKVVCNQTMPELLRSAKLAVEKGQAQGRDGSYVKQLSDYIIPGLVEALHKEPETEICASMLDSLNECIQLSGPLLDEAQVRSIVDEIKHVITASTTRKRERSERTKAEDFDAEEGELLEEENEQEEELFDQVGDCLGTLIKTFKASFLPFFDELSVYITPMWIVPAWLSCLPIKSDLIEAKIVHEQLCSMVERSDRELLGPNNQFLPKIVAVFAEVLCAGKDLATEQTASRMINLLRQLQQTMPPAVLASTISSLQPQQQLALQYYDTYLPFLLEACNDANPDVRQAAVYGIGVCAEFGGSVFRPLVGEALSRLNNLLRRPDAQNADNIMAYDNAVSALGKICLFHRDGIDASQIVPAWLSCLPIKSDLIEAKIVHEQLCSMVERSDRELLGPNNQFLPKIVAVFAEVLCAGKDLATEQTASRMINLLRQLQQTMPPAVLASTISSLQPQQQLALHCKSSHRPSTPNVPKNAGPSTCTGASTVASDDDEKKKEESLIDEEVYRPCFVNEVDHDQLGFSNSGSDGSWAFESGLEIPFFDGLELNTSDCFQETIASELDVMKVERQISASLYAMNGVQEYLDAVNDSSDSLWDLPPLYHSLCRS